MKKTPDIIFVVDGEYESQAVKEANSLGLPVYAISNTNGNPYDLTDAIPANTNSVKSLDYLAGALLSGIKSAKVTKSAAPKKAIEKKAPAKKTAPKKEEAVKTEEK